MNYYKRHIGDYAAKAGHLTALEHGVYCLILDGYYNREQGPTRAEALRWARARSADEIAAVDAVLSEFFYDDNGTFKQSRVEEELAAFRSRQETNRRLGARGGKANAKRIATESLSEREANEKPSHKPLTNNQDKKQKTAPDGDLFAGVSEQVKNDFKALRAKLRAPITQTAMDGIRREAGKAGLSLEAALVMCCERGWRGFKAEWAGTPTDQPRKRPLL